MFLTFNALIDVFLKGNRGKIYSQGRIQVLKVSVADNDKEFDMD